MLRVHHVKKARKPIHNDKGQLIVKVGEPYYYAKARFRSKKVWKKKPSPEQVNTYYRGFQIKKSKLDHAKESLIKRINEIQTLKTIGAINCLLESLQFNQWSKHGNKKI